MELPHKKSLGVYTVLSTEQTGEMCTTYHMLGLQTCHFQNKGTDTRYIYNASSVLKTQQF